MELRDTQKWTSEMHPWLACKLEAVEELGLKSFFFFFPPKPTPVLVVSCLSFGWSFDASCVRHKSKMSFPLPVSFCVYLCACVCVCVCVCVCILVKVSSKASHMVAVVKDEWEILAPPSLKPKKDCGHTLSQRKKKTHSAYNGCDWWCSLYIEFLATYSDHPWIWVSLFHGGTRQQWLLAWNFIPIISCFNRSNVSYFHEWENFEKRKHPSHLVQLHIIVNPF